MSTDTVVIACFVDRMTDKAVHIRYKDGQGRERECWLPLSECEAPDTIHTDDEELVISKWLAMDRDIPHDH